MLASLFLEHPHFICPVMLCVYIKRLVNSWAINPTTNEPLNKSCLVLGHRYAHKSRDL